MKTSKGIMCMTCKVEHQPGNGYHFGEDLSVICDKCDKAIFPTTSATEDKMPKFYSNDRKSRTSSTTTVSRTHYGSSCYDYD